MAEPVNKKEKMITTLYNYGKNLQNVPELKKYFSHIENPFEGRENGKVLVAIIENNYFKGFEVEDFKEKKFKKYLYRSLPAPRSNGIVPCLYINLSGKDKKGKTGIEKTANKLNKNLNQNRALLQIQNQPKLIKKFIKYSFDKNYSYIFTCKIDGEFLGEISDFGEKLFDNAYLKYFRRTKTKNKYIESKAENKLCSITNTKTEVVGFVDLLGFTVNNKAYNRNGFQLKSAYKMFPVAKKALPILEASLNIMLKENTSDFFKFKKIGQSKPTTIKYSILPNFIFENDNQNSYLTKKFLGKSFNIDSGKASSFINSTEDILKELIEDKELRVSDIYYSILFFEENNAQFKIYLSINDVIPSRISKILEFKNKSEKAYSSITSYNYEGKIVNPQIYLTDFKKYYTLNNQVQPSYFKLIQSIFTGSTFNSDKLQSLILSHWRALFRKYAFKKDENYKFKSAVKNTLPELLFLNQLQIFKPKLTMSEPDEIEKLDAFSFIENHPAYFTSEYMKGAFIFGCLVSRLFIEQQGNAFMRELNGLNIDKELVAKKFPKLIAKLRQYKMRFKSLEVAASNYFAVNDDAKKDDISFAFTLGMILQENFDQKNKEANNNKSKNQDNE